MSDGGRPRLGFIGVGAMGLPMGRNLLRAGYPLAFCTSRDAAAEALVAAGGARLADPAAVAGACDILLTCLPADAEIETAMLGEGGALDALREGGTIIELSTASPAIMRRLGERAASRGVAVLDAPVSGGTSGAEAATLAIMVGGAADDLDACRPILETLGKNIYHVGPVGMGKVFKLCNQYLAAANTALDRRGADPRRGRRGRPAPAGRGDRRQFGGLPRPRPGPPTTSSPPSCSRSASGSI